jgi:hypothetical protein
VRAAVAEVRIRIPLRYWAVFILLFIANIYVAVSSATYGAQVMSIEKQMKAVAEENKKLMEVMVAQQSLQNVSQKAEELGLVRPTDVIYLDAPSSLTAAF